MTTSRKPLPRTSDPVAFARSIAPKVRELAAQAEKDAVVSEELTTEFYENGLYTLMVPTELGGGTTDGEATPRQMLDTIEEIAAADGSTAWALMASMAGMGAIYSGMSEAGAEALLESPNPVTAGESAPTGTARRVDGGYMVSGEFRYASGSNFAGWFNGAYVLIGDDGAPVVGDTGQKTIISGILPRDQVELRGNWDVLGLVATASVDYRITDQFLPDHLVRQKELQYGDALHRVSPRALTTLAHTGISLGLMRGALEEYVKFAHEKSRPPAGLVASHETAQRDYATWHLGYRSARAFAQEVFETLRATGEAGMDTTSAQQADGRLAGTHAAYTAADITRNIYLACGGDGLRNGPNNRVQRFFRDAHAASQHMLTGPHVYVEAGRIYLDAPGMQETHKRIFDHVFAPPLTAR